MPLLLLSFGGPEGPEQVRPFLENVTRGRDIPPERLDDVAEHYLHFGGVSPINGINRALIEQLQVELADAAPTCRSTSATATGSPTSRTPLRPCATTASGGPRCSPRRRGAATPSCTQYVEDIAAGPRGGRAATHPNWSSCASTSTTRCSSRCSPTRIADAAATLPDELRGRGAAGVHRALDPAARPRRGAARTSTAPGRVRVAPGRGRGRATHDYDQVWQSRSGPPQVPWLEPDVADHLSSSPSGHQGRHRLPDRLRRRPHRGGVGSRQRAARTGRGRRHRIRPGAARPTPTAASPSWPSA